MISPYRGHVADSIRTIMGDRETYKTYTIYEVAGNPKKPKWYYINRRDFMHILSPVAYWYGDTIHYYAVRDCVVTKDGKLKVSKEYGQYNNKMDAVAAIKNFFK